MIIEARNQARARVVLAALSTALLALALACDRTSKSDPCPMVAPGVMIPAPAIDVSIRDAYGRGQAIGSSVSATVGNNTYPLSVDDTVHADGPEGSSAGTYAVLVKRPYYHDATLSRVVVGVGMCGGVPTTKVAVTLTLVAGAPPVRALAVLDTAVPRGPQDFWNGSLLKSLFLATPGEKDRFIAWFDADPGVSTAVTWRLSDTTLATIDATGLVTSKCSVPGGTDTVTAVSVADPTVRGSTTVGVGAQSHCP